MLEEERKFYILILLTTLAALVVVGMALSTPPSYPVAQAQVGQPQVIHSGQLVSSTTTYLYGNFGAWENRYVAGRFGQSTAATRTITITLGLANPVGMRCCTQTVASSVPVTGYARFAMTMTGPYWSQVWGTIDPTGMTGTITPVTNIILHGH